MCGWLARPEGDDAADGIVRRNADGHAIPGNHFDAEAAHSTAELGQHFVAGVALHAIETAAVDRHHRALHVDEIAPGERERNHSALNRPRVDEPEIADSFVEASIECERGERDRRFIDGMRLERSRQERGSYVLRLLR